jgi:IPT/TIG domain
VSLALLAAALLLVLPARTLVAQGATPRVTTVDPSSGKANDVVTVTGENLEKAHVSAIFLSDDKDDHKASVVSQAADKIVMKIPEVKPGDYNVSIQSGNAIFIQPVRFTVQ